VRFLGLERDWGLAMEGLDGSVGCVRGGAGGGGNK
jgi:hypothetical protein